jgi:26S proteasome non-ATPase regulatory subunit 10
MSATDEDLFFAAWDGKTDEVLQWYLSHDDHGAQDNIDEETQDNALHVAVLNKHPDVVMLLLGHGADPNLRCNGTTPLCEAAGNFTLAIAGMLLQHGADVERVNGVEGDHPMHRAAAGGDRAMALLLLSRGAEVSPTNQCGATPLHMAALEDEFDMCQLLLEHGADLEAMECGETPEEYSRGVSEPEITLMLSQEAARRAQWLAFAMGQHDRLGVGSLVRSLEPEVFRMVLKQM